MGMPSAFTVLWAWLPGTGSRFSPPKSDRSHSKIFLDHTGQFAHFIVATADAEIEKTTYSGLFQDDVDFGKITYKGRG